MYASETYLPRNENDLAGLIAQAVSQGLPLEVCGNRTKRAVGRPLQVGARVSARELTGITLYEPAELVIAARAGTPLDEIEAQLAANGQELAFEPCRLDRLPPGADGALATIGGIVATNASGPRRVLRGAARDHVIGMRGVNGLGEIIKSGGRVMKNVTGYDLARGLTGSWGTLAVMTEITLKVLPKAEETRTLLFLGLPDEAAVAALSTAMGSAYEVSGTVHLQQPFAERLSNPDLSSLKQAVTALRVENFAASVEYRTGRLHDALTPFGALYELEDDRSRAFWNDIRNLTFLSSSDWPLWRISAAPHQAARLIRVLTTQIECRAAYEWSGGLIWVEVAPATDASATVLRRIIAEFQADATLIRADEAARASVDVFQPLPEANMTLIRRLKEAFDPHHVLNPGRMYAGI